MRAFELIRDEDASGVSGTGKVAEGLEFSDGAVAMMWVTSWPTSLVIYPAPDGMRAIEHIHGHEGRSRIVWMHRIVVQSEPDPPT